METNVQLVETTAGDPAMQELIVAQERELSERYGQSKTGTGIAPESPAVVAYVDGRAVGCVAVSLTGPGGELKRMYVDPSVRGRRLSRLLLSRVEELAVRLGVVELRLTTGTEQPEAMALYSRSGYVSVACGGEEGTISSTRCFEKTLGDASAAHPDERRG